MQAGSPSLSAIVHDFPHAAVRGTQLQVQANWLRPTELHSPGFVLELLPGKAVQTNPHHTQTVEREVSASHSARRELRDVIPTQK